MMKKSKFTIFMKTFMLILIPIFIIELWHTQIDFTKEIEMYVQSYSWMNINDMYIYDFEDLIRKEGDIKSPTVLKNIPISGNNRYIALLDDKKNIIYEEFSDILKNQTPKMDIILSGTQYEVDLSSIDKQTIEKIEEIIIENYSLPEKEFLGEIIGEMKEINRDEMTLSIIVPDFLNLENLIIYGDNKEEPMTFKLKSYSSPNIFYADYPYYNDNDDYTFVDFTRMQESAKKVMESSINKEPLFQRNNQTIIYEIEGDDLYIIDRGEIWTSDAKIENLGQLVQVSRMEGLVSLTKENILKEKRNVYIASFLFAVVSSFLVSYMITRRIKEIEKATHEIEQNNFDVKLKEKPYDELGQLSRSINSMSSQLELNIKLLNEEIEQVKQLEKMRKAFVAQFTHEIKTPLSIINGYIELIGDIKDETKKEDYLLSIEKEVESVNQLVLAMLNLSRLESGNVTLTFKELDLEEMVSELIDEFIPLLNKKHLKIQFEGDSYVILADETEMKLVIKNLLSNAIKHTPQFGSIYIIFKENSFSIENEGMHITDEQKDNIWNNYVSTERDGTGLGLAICKSVLDLHEFTYEARNTEKGVCFTILFNKKRKV